MVNAVQKDNCKEVIIGNHVWIASDVQILKGSVIADGSVVGCHSVVLGKFQEPSVLVGGYPARVLQKNVTWKK